MMTEFERSSDTSGTGAGRGNVFGTKIARQNPSRSTPLREHSDGLVINGLWQRPGLPMRERRLITMTILARYNKEDWLALHVAGALENDEFTLEELDEVALHLAFYAGWPVGNMFARTVEETVKKMEAPPQ
jgi:4-carboxymuconolactone decarboxylase